MLSSATHISALLLVLIFAWAGAAKVLRWRRWRDALARYRLGRTLERVAFVGVPATEVLVAVLFVAGQVRIGAALVVALVSAFSLAVVRARGLEGDKLPCGCFGRTGARDYKGMLVRNALIASLAGTVLVVARIRDVVPLAPTGAELVPAALIVIGVGVAAWVLWQVSVSLRRKA